MNKVHLIPSLICELWVDVLLSMTEWLRGIRVEPVWRSWWRSTSPDGKWQSCTCRRPRSSARSPSSSSRSRSHDPSALRDTDTISRVVCMHKGACVTVWSSRPGRHDAGAVPESESGSERSKPPTLLTMLRRWMAVQAKGIRKRPRRLQDCSACRRSFSSFSLCWRERERGNKEQASVQESNQKVKSEPATVGRPERTVNIAAIQTRLRNMTRL